MMVGLGEGVALSCMNSLIASYLPPAVKSRALGICFSGFHCGEQLAASVVPGYCLARRNIRPGVHKVVRCTCVLLNVPLRLERRRWRQLALGRDACCGPL